MKAPLLSCLFSLTAAMASAAQPSIQHRFLAVDDGTHSLHYVDQADPARNWKVPSGGYCMDMQLIGEGRVLLAIDDGYREFDIATGKELKVVKGLGGRSHGIERLPDGRTILLAQGGGGLNGV